MAEFTYKPDGDVLKAFGRDRESRVKLIRGPVGSAKSSACCVDLFMRALMQQPDVTGWKKTRFVIVRRSYPDLLATTVKTWRDWFPEASFGKMTLNPPMPRHHIVLPDEKLDIEIIFKSVPDDRPETLESLSSLEVTAAWINEAREFPFAVVDRLRERIDRYPRRDNERPQELPGATYPGLILDTNSPPDDHWWAIMSGDREPPEWMSEEDREALVKPEGWSFYTQPPAVFEEREQGEFRGWRVNPDHENKRYLSKAYYPQALKGKSYQVVKVQYANEYGDFHPGRVVHPLFEPSVHVSSRTIEVAPRHPICWGQDFGRTPSAIFVQEVEGQLRVLRECLGSNMGAQRFVTEKAKPFVARHFGWMPHLVWLYSGDPRGEDLTQADENSPFLVFRAHGVPMQAAPTNDPTIRIGVIDHYLGKMLPGGRPGLIVDPSCTVTIAALGGRYHYRRIAGDNTRFDDKPNKNHPYSDIMDALQYAALRLGGQHAMLGHTQQVAVIDGSYDAMEEAWSVHP